MKVEFVEKVVDVEAERLRVVAEACTWLGTPYHHQGRLKGVGVDCSMLLAEVYHRVGIMPAIEVKSYPHDWHLHRNEEWYADEVQKHAVEIDGPPLPGDIALWQFGRTYSHGAIVLEWPVVIHSYLQLGVVRENVEKARWLKYVGENTQSKGKLRPLRFYRPKAWV